MGLTNLMTLHHFISQWKHIWFPNVVSCP